MGDGPLPDGCSAGPIFWDREEIRARLAKKMGHANVEEDGLTLRQAVLVAGIREVAAALDARGLYP